MAEPPVVARVELPPEGLLGLTGPARLTLEADTLEISAAGGTVSLATGAIDGVSGRGGTLVLYAHGRAWELAGDEGAAAVARALTSRARSLAGVTRALRSRGSTRAAPGTEHDRFFQPLLNARRRAERAADDQVRLAAFDGETLARAYRAAAAELARARRSPGHPSARRALEEELLEIVEPVTAACARVGAAALAVTHAGDESRLAAWRDWTRAVRALFASADARWPAVREALARPAPRRRSWLRRLLAPLAGR